MGIRLEQPGAAKAAAGAGAAIGKGKRAEEDRARAEREQARAQQIAAQQEARKAAMKWEQEKMAMRSQQDFQQELTAKQWEFEKFNRAKAWEIDKLEIRSRMDFEQDEKKRIQEIDAFINGVESIKKSDTIDDEGKKRALYSWANKYPDVEEAAQYLGYDPRTPKETEPSFAQMKAAAKYMEETELGWKERHLPKILGGRELTETEIQLRAEAEEILIPTGTISSVEPIYQENKRTGQKRVSEDGGRTWRIL